MVYTGFVFIGLFLSALLSPFSRQEITRAFPTNPWLPTCRHHGGGDQNAVKVRRWMMFFFRCFLGVPLIVGSTHHPGAKPTVSMKTPMGQVGHRSRFATKTCPISKNEAETSLPPMIHSSHLPIAGWKFRHL